MKDVLEAAGRFGQLTQAVEWALAAAFVIGLLFIAWLIYRGARAITASFAAARHTIADIQTREEKP